MVKGVYHYLGEAWKKPTRELLQPYLIKWRAGRSIERVEKPLRLDKARMLGYKAKKGFVVVRVRVKRGGHKRKRQGVKGRKSTKQTIRKSLKMNYRWIAEMRAARRYSSLEVLNSYWVGKDGKHYYFEVILVDTTKPEIQKDKNIKWITSGKNKKRVERGLTSAAKKSRGLKSKKGKSPELKVRPSLRAWDRKGK